MNRNVGQHHGDLRKALLAAALALVEETNIDAVTLRAVARRAGVSPGACYHHFPDKDALLAEVAREGFAALAAEQARQQDPDPRVRLGCLAATYVHFALAHGTHYRVMFRASPSDIEGVGSETLRTTARATFDTLVGAIAQVVPEAGAAAWLSRALVAWAQVHGAVEVARWASDLDPAFVVETFAEAVAEQVVCIAVGERGAVARTTVDRPATRRRTRS
jgi:AcrR family transcriptional regulator